MLSMLHFHEMSYCGAEFSVCFSNFFGPFANILVHPEKALLWGRCGSMSNRAMWRYTVLGLLLSDLPASANLEAGVSVNHPISYTGHASAQCVRWESILCSAEPFFFPIILFSWCAWQGSRDSLLGESHWRVLIPKWPGNVLITNIFLHKFCLLYNLMSNLAQELERSSFVFVVISLF